MQKQTQGVELTLPDESREGMTQELMTVEGDFQTDMGLRLFLAAALKISTRYLPIEWLMLLDDVRSNRICPPYVWIKNLPCDDISNIPTPTDGFLSKLKQTHIAEAVQLAFCQLIGIPYCFLLERRKAGMVHAICPRPGQEKALTSESSATTLDWHIEHAFSKLLRPFWVSLFCLRPDMERAAITKLADARDAIPYLSASALQVLRESNYSFFLPDSMGMNGVSEPMPILSGPLAEPDLRFSLEGKTVVVHSNPVKVAAGYSAVQEFGQLMDVPQLQHQIRLESGQLLLMNNLTAAHCRTEFKFNNDLTKNRWLHRVIVRPSLFEARATRSERINQFI